jgi:hypothetical protein
MAKLIAGKGRLAVAAAKETVNAAFELPLAEGVRFERRVFHSLFGTPDQKEGVCNPRVARQLLTRIFRNGRVYREAQAELRAHQGMNRRLPSTLCASRTCT